MPYTCIRQPLNVANAAEIEWDEEADVIVVGFGGAGAAAAVQAAEAGAQVIAVDRFGGGGATAYSGGVIYIGGTRHQRESGFDDTPQAMYDYLSQEVTSVGPGTLKRYCDGSNADLEWLEGHGVEYGSNAYLGKTAFPPDGHWIYYSGNEMLPKFAETTTPAPRGHRVKTPGFGGHLHFGRLREAAIARGVRVLPHAPAQRLIVDREGRVIGVEVNALPPEAWDEHQKLYAVVSPWKPLNNTASERAIERCRALEEKVDRPRRIRARGGVVLSTGGFIYNLDMLGRHRDGLARSYQGLLRIGSMGCDGSGIELGQSVGGVTGHMDRVYVGRPISPPEAFVYGLMVNVAGRRFVNEDAYQTLFGDRLAEQPEDGRAVLVLEARHFWLGVRQALFPGRGMFKMWGAPALLNMAMGGTKRGRTIEALARRCRIDPAGLRATVDEWNVRVRAGAADPFGKADKKSVPLERGPFYAINVSIDNKYGPTFAFTLGGLSVNEATGEVKDADGRDIAGLYAAGRTAVGLCTSGYMSGLSIADTVFSGRRAGGHAAERVNPPGTAMNVR